MGPVQKAKPQVTIFFDKKVYEYSQWINKNNYSNKKKQQAEKESIPRREKIFMQRIMYEMMLPKTTNRSSEWNTCLKSISNSSQPTTKRYMTLSSAERVSGIMETN
jgi:hypothetical protein